MKDETVKRLKNRDLWSRVLYMILFAIAYNLAEFILFFVVVFQFFTTLITGVVNEPLLRFGNNLSVYIYKILRFLTFNTEQHPFPFEPWPNEAPGGESWSGAAPIAPLVAPEDKNEAPSTDAGSTKAGSTKATSTDATSSGEPDPGESK